MQEGWFYDKESVKIAKIPAMSASEEYAFTVKAPAVCAARRIRPVNFVYTCGDVVSTPAVQPVWFQEEPLEKKDALH